MADASQAIHEHSCFRRHASAGSLPLGNAGILAGQWRSHLIRTLTSFRNSDRWQDQKMARKIQAAPVKVPSHFMGKTDTQEKFDAHKR